MDCGYHPTQECYRPYRAALRPNTTCIIVCALVEIFILCLMSSIVSSRSYKLSWRSRILFLLQESCIALHLWVEGFKHSQNMNILTKLVFIFGQEPCLSTGGRCLKLWTDGKTLTTHKIWIISGLSSGIYEFLLFLALNFNSNV